MTRRWTVLLAGLASLILASLTLAIIANTDTPSASTVSAPSPPSVGGDVGAIQPEGIAWVFAAMPAMGMRDGAFVLQAGTLAGDAPLLDREVRWAVDLNSDLTREPAVGPPIDYSVVYVADDGALSIVRRAEIARDGRDVPVAELSEVIWDIAVAPDNSVVYAALTDRETRENDLGVVRIRLDGSGEIEQVMFPAEIADGGDIVRVAFVSFNVRLMMSDDGRHLARRSCAGSDGCLTEVLDLTTGATSPVPDGELAGIASGFMVLTQCDEAGCGPRAVDLVTGVSLALPLDGALHVTSVDGRPVVITTSSDPNAGASIDVIDILSGERHELFRSEPGSWSGVNSAFGLTVAVPAGHVHVTHSTPLPDEGGAVVEMRTRELLIAIDDGRITEIPPAPIRPLPGFNMQG
jgi:hypothetical protein